MIAGWKFAVRNAAGRLIRDSAAQGPFQDVAQALLRVRGKRLCDLGVIADASDAVFPIAEASVFVRAAPRFEGEAPRVEPGIFPPVNAYLMRDAGVCVHSGHLLKGGQLLVSQERYRQRHRIPSNGGSLGFYNDRHAFCTTRQTQRLEDAIFLGGDGSYNWYHFIVECMTKAFMIRFLPNEFQDFPLIVPDEVNRINAFKEVLAALLPGRRLIVTGHESVTFVERLVVFGDASIGPFNLYPGIWPVLSDYGHNEALISAFVNELRRLFAPPDTRCELRRRLFIVRSGTRRNYNQAELIKIAARHGFEPFSPENLSLREQANVYADASHLIGASGAAFVNILFSTRPIRSLSWLLPEYRDFSSYSMLAHLLGHDLRFLMASTDCGRVRSTNEASKYSQSVCPSEFEAAVVRLCDND